MKSKASHYKKYGKYKCEKRKLKTTYDLTHCHFHYFLFGGGCLCVCEGMWEFSIVQITLCICYYLFVPYPILFGKHSSIEQQKLTVSITLILLPCFINSKCIWSQLWKWDVSYNQQSSNRFSQVALQYMWVNHPQSLLVRSRKCQHQNSFDERWYPTWRIFPCLMFNFRTVLPSQGEYFGARPLPSLVKRRPDYRIQVTNLSISLISIMKEKRYSKARYQLSWIIWATSTKDTQNSLLVSDVP